MRSLLLLSILPILVACTTLPESLEIEPSPGASARCRALVREIPSMKAVDTLDRLSDLIALDCKPEALRLGRWIRETYREKTYSVTRESLSVLLPEDAISEYVLESYERAYLSYVLAALEYSLGHPDRARVELRRGYREGKALLYNYGEDPVNVVLLATLWETLEEPDTARPFWMKAKALSDSTPELKGFAQKQIERLDKQDYRQWQVQRVGTMPELDWQTKFGGGHGAGYYDIYAKKPLPGTCASETGVTITTQPWIDKISLRHSSNYHPLLNAKTWVRLPIGVLYGAGVVAGGVAIATVGCAAASEEGGAELCGHAVGAGVQIASHAGEMTSFAIRPDLRHWKKVPAGFVITTKNSLAEEKCTPPTPPPPKPPTNWWKSGDQL
ncbi:MAG: hypothetical protein V4760_14225, partial [Bdellovibrionota bacterium]